MSIRTSFNPLGTLGGWEPVPELADTITVPKRCAMVVPLYGLQEFIVEFATDFAGTSAYNIVIGALGFIGYGNSTSGGWITYRSFSGTAAVFTFDQSRPQRYKFTARKSSVRVEYNVGVNDINVSGDLRDADMTLAGTTPSSPERDVDIPLTGGSFVVKAIDGTLVHDYRFRADGLGFYDMEERKNYYFNA